MDFEDCPPIPPNCEYFNEGTDDCAWFHWPTRTTYFQRALCSPKKHAMAAYPEERYVIASVAYRAWIAESDRIVSQSPTIGELPVEYDEAVVCADAWIDWGNADE